MDGAAEPVLAGVELGGTKAVVIIGRGQVILARHVVPTADPSTTMAAVATILRALVRDHRPAALGIASFGPVGLVPDTAAYGQMLPTPKPGWGGAAILAPLAALVDGPAMIHTDVTAAALAEARWGAAIGCRDLIYATIGTGIGMGIIAGGRPIAGTLHPEAGHIRVRRVAGDGFTGICPFHGDCLEGLASGPAVAARAGVPAGDLAPESPHWFPVVDALAEALAMLMLTTSPERIIIGGGLGVGQPHLLRAMRSDLLVKLAGYHPAVSAATVDTLLVPAALGNDAGPLGALCLAAGALGT